MISHGNSITAIGQSIATSIAHSDVSTASYIDLNLLQLKYESNPWPLAAPRWQPSNLSLPSSASHIRSCLLFFPNMLSTPYASTHAKVGHQIGSKGYLKVRIFAYYDNTNQPTFYIINLNFGITDTMFPSCLSSLPLYTSLSTIQGSKKSILVQFAALEAVALTSHLIYVQK